MEWLKKNIECNPFQIICFGVVMILVTMLCIMLTFDCNGEQKNEIINYNIFSHYWICMDGCYYMEEIILGKFDYFNETQKQYHGICADKCWNNINYESSKKTITS